MSRVIAEPPRRAGHLPRDMCVTLVTRRYAESRESGAGHSSGVTRVGQTSLPRKPQKAWMEYSQMLPHEVLHQNECHGCGCTT